MERFLLTLTKHKHLTTMAVLCVTAVGIGGWYLLRDDAPAEALPVPAQAEVSAPAPEIRQELPAPPVLPVPESPQPVIVPEELLPEPEEQSAPVSAPVVDDAPVVAAPPKLVVSPLKGEVLAAFAVEELIYSETFDDWRIHDGIDIAAEAGTTVLAASSGTVINVFNDDMMGTTVIIDHGDGHQTTYANLQARPTVEAGEQVSAGQIIGAVGTTAAAESALGPHLHFSVSKDGDAVSPEEYLKK